MAGNSGAIRAGRAYYELYSDQNPLNKGLKQAEGAVQASMKAVSDKARAIGSSMAASVAASIAAVASPAAALKLFASTGADLQNLANRTGASAKALSSLGYAAKQTGSDVHAMAALMITLRDKTMEAARGSEQAQLAFYRLGIDFLQLSTMRPEDQLRLVAERLSAIQNPAFRAALAIELLGSADLLPTLARLGELEAEASRLGLTLSDESVAAAKKFDETLTALWESLKQVGMAIGEALVPAVTTLAQEAIAVLGPIREWISTHQEIVTVAAAVVAGLGVLTAAVTALSVAMGAAGIAAGALSLAFGALTSPITLTVAAIAAAGFALVQLTEYLTGVKWSLAEVGRAVKGVTQLFRDEWGKTLDWFAKRWIDVKELAGFISSDEAAAARADIARSRAGKPLGSLPAGGGGVAGPVGFSQAPVVAAANKVAEEVKKIPQAAAAGAAIGAAHAAGAAAKTGPLPGIGSALFHIRGVGARDVRSKEGFKALIDSLSQRQSPALQLQMQQYQLQQRAWVDLHNIRLKTDKIGLVGL